MKCEWWGLGIWIYLFQSWQVLKEYWLKRVVCPHANLLLGLLTSSILTYWGRHCWHVWALTKPNHFLPIRERNLKSQANRTSSTICCLCLSSGVLCPSSRQRLSHLQSTVPYLSLMTFVSLAHTHTHTHTNMSLLSYLSWYSRPHTHTHTHTYTPCAAPCAARIN